MSRLPWIVGGGAVAAYLWSRGHKQTARAPLENSAAFVGPLPGRWVWPVPRWNGRSPVISDGFYSPRPGVPLHGGVDVMFARTPNDAFKPGTSNGSKTFVMPDGLVAVAASDGVVWSAMQTPRGFAVVIDHGPVKVCTFYTHLEKLLLTPTANAATRQRVQAGQAIGVIGFDPLDAQKLKHLHFEVWTPKPTDKVDPAPLMRSWEIANDPREALVARNASLVYRPIGDAGEPYPQWVRDLQDTSGVYVIRELDAVGNPEVVYVGSSRGQLYSTLTRHFQSWRRAKRFWKGMYGDSHDPGLTYERDRVEVAIRRTRKDEALAEEARLIERLRPRDNLLLQPVDEDEAVPF